MYWSGGCSVRCNVLDSDLKDDECKGSVTLYEGSEETMVTKDQEVNVVVDKVKVEGCGCFTLHSKKGGRGKREHGWGSKS